MCGDKFMSDCFHTAGSPSRFVHEQSSIGSLWGGFSSDVFMLRSHSAHVCLSRFQGGVNKVSARSGVLEPVNEQKGESLPVS